MTNWRRRRSALEFANCVSIILFDVSKILFNEGKKKMKKTILVSDIVIPIHKDWENQNDLIGEGRLLNKVSEGLPFILSDINESGEPIPIGKQVVYSYEV